MQKMRVDGDDFWVIEGTPILEGGWVGVPNPEQFYLESKFHQATVVNLSSAEYSRFFNYYRKFVNARWDILDREPDNEQQVISLFTRYLHKFGFTKYLRIGYRETPDALLLTNSGRSVPVEFELTSRGLENHTLRELKGATCICWVDDLPIDSPYRKKVKVRPIKQKIFDILNPEAI